MPKWTEECLRRTLSNYDNGMFANGAADLHGIPCTTFKAKIHRRDNSREAHGYQKKLSPIQEKYLRNWILIQADLGVPVTHQQLRDFASKVAKCNGHDGRRRIQRAVVNGLVLGNVVKKLALNKQPGSRAWTSILECCSASTKILPLLIIFKGATVQQQYFPEALS
jgi:hypothetical protein